MNAPAFDPAGMWNDIAVDLARRGYTASAVAACRRAVDMAPDRADLRSNYGNMLRRDGRMKEARQELEIALSLDHRHAPAIFNIGCWWMDSLGPEGALEWIRIALETDPTNVDWRFAKAACLLQLGRWPEAFFEYEVRLDRKDYRMSIPLWKGEDLTDKTLLIHGEQGLGDTIMFARFLRHFREARIAVQPPLVRLMGCEQMGEDWPADYRLPIMSIPHRLGLTDVAAAPYIVPTHKLTLPSPPGAKAKVGLVWKAKTQAEHMTVDERLHGAQKSIPLEKLLELTRLPGVALFGLQPGVTDIADIGAQHLVTDLGPRIFDFADLASFIDQMDVLVSVDTAPAHLAGAMGKPVVVVCHHAGSWQWGTSDRSVWYEEARIVRQKEPGIWPVDDIVAEVENALGS